MTRYDYLSLVAMIAVPLAPAFFFGHMVYTAVAMLPAPAWLAIIIGVAAAVGLELVGILAGHVANTAWTVKDYGRAALGALVMVVYVAIGVVELWGSIGAVMFLIAPLVYLLAALQEGLHTAVNQQVAETAVSRQQEQEERRQQREHEQRMELERLRLAHDEKLARIAAKPQPQPRQIARQDTGNLPHDWRQLTGQQRRDLAHLTREGREALMPELSERARRDWHNRLDEIAAQNGSYVG
ncbi:MAG: hypothetical protein KF770_17580 [Anaerolineae bacterium]|nr:hypothetical protein [Anaerolineae bacterium]